MVDPGSMRHRLTLEAPTETDDGAGGVNRGFTPVGTLWAAMTSLTGRESLQQDVLARRITHRIVLRYRPDITAAYRLRLGLRSFEIIALRDPDERRTFLECLCEEIAP